MRRLHRGCLGLLLIFLAVNMFLPNSVATSAEVVEIKSNASLGEIKFTVSSPLEVTSGKPFSITVTMKAKEDVWFSQYGILGWIRIYIYEGSKEIVSDVYVVSPSERWPEGYERTKTYSIKAGPPGILYYVLISTFHFYEYGKVTGIIGEGGTADIFCGLSREMPYDQMVETFETTFNTLKYTTEIVIKEKDETIKRLESDYNLLNASYVLMKSAYDLLNATYLTLQSKYAELKDKNQRLESDVNMWRLGAIMSGAVALVGIVGYISERKKRKAFLVPPPLTSERKPEG
jgi:hypothetical protein